MFQTCILDPSYRLLDATPADRLAHTVRTSPLLLARPSLKRCAPSQRQSAVPDAATARTHTSLYQTRLRLALYMHLYEASSNTILVVTMRSSPLQALTDLATKTSLNLEKLIRIQRQGTAYSAKNALHLAPTPVSCGHRGCAPLRSKWGGLARPDRGARVRADEGSNSRCLAITLDGRRDCAAERHRVVRATAGGCGWLALRRRRVVCEVCS